MTAHIPAQQRDSGHAPGPARLGAYGVAAMLHVAALAAIAVMPPEQRERFERTGQGIEIRFYTVSAADAESDLPLNMPLLADRLDDGAQAGQPGGADGEDGGRGSADDAEGDDPADNGDEAEVSAQDELSDPEDLTGEAPAEPEQEPAPRPAETDESAPSIVTAPARETSAPSAPPPAFRPAPPPPSGPVAPDRPVDTIQPPEEEAVRPTVRLPTFAEIAARADTRLRPEDFRTGNLDGGVRAVLAEAFCLASGEGMREAGNCGDEPNPAQAELAIYRIRAMSRDMPQFMENMSRAEFELMQLGASPSTLQLIRHHFEQARREAVNTPAIVRAMDRDGRAQTDHLGISRPITPRHVLDPSGER
ncbi:MAG: hypothetical protein ACK4NO_00535 [Glycocaulis sp.]